MRRLCLLGLSLALVACAGGGQPGVTQAPRQATGASADLHASHLVQFAVPTQNAQVSSLTAGLQSNMWFVEIGSAKIGKLSSSGTITEYNIPGKDTQAGSRIVDGGPGFLWFEASLGIYKLTVHGAITLAIPGPSQASYTGLVLGPDGNLWSTGGFFTGSDDTVFRFTPGGSYTEFTTPTPNSCPESPVVGSDGNIWVVESCVHQVAKVTTAGAITEYPLPSGNDPVDSAEGDDGALYVSDLFDNVLHRVATDGTVTDFALPSPSEGLGQGPHHLLWIILNHTARGVRTFNTMTHVISGPLRVSGAVGASVAFDYDRNAWFPALFGQAVEEYTDNL
jgi:streptogramin lyase